MKKKDHLAIRSVIAERIFFTEDRNGQPKQ